MFLVSRLNRASAAWLGSHPRVITTFTVNSIIIIIKALHFGPGTRALGQGRGASRTSGLLVVLLPELPP